MWKFKHDIKLWRSFFGRFSYHSPTFKVFLSDLVWSARTTESLGDDSKTVDLSITIRTENEEDVQFTLNTRDARTLGTMLLGYADAWDQRNFDKHNGYKAHEIEQLFAKAKKE